MNTRCLRLLSPTLTNLLMAGALCAQGSDRGLYMPLDDFQLLSSGPANVVLNGSVVVNTPEFEIIVHSNSGGNPTGIDAEILLAGGLTLEITADGDGSFSQSIPAALVPLPPFQIGPTILILPYALILVELEGQAAAGMRASFVQEFEVPMQLAIGPGVHVSSGTPDVINMFGTPEVNSSSTASLQANVTAGVLFLVSWNGISIGGPYAGATFGVELTLDPLADPWWRLDGHLAPFTGYVGPVVLNYDFPVPPFAIGDAGGPLLSTPPTTRWSEALDVVGNEILHAVAPTADGLLTVGRTDGGRPWVGVLDDTGAVIVAVRGDAQPFGYQRPVAALPQDDGGCVLVGNPSSGSGLRVDRLTSLGAVTWSHTLSHPTAPLLSVSAAVALPGGEFAVAGTSTTLSPAGSRAYVTRFGTDGLPLWTTEIDPGPVCQKSTASALVLAADGDLLLAGSADFEQFDGPDQVLGNKNVWLARLSPQGALRWANSAGTISDESGSSLAVSADGSISVGTVIQDGGSDWAALYRFDGDGNLSYGTAYHGDETGIVAYRVVALSPVDGGTLMLGTVNHGASRDTFLALVGDSGLVLWWKTIGGSDEDDAVGLAALPDGVLAWGFTRSPDDQGSGTGQDGWLLRTDVDGMLHFEAGNSFDARNDSVWWADWSPVVAASTLTPSGVPVTLTATVAPLSFSVSSAAVNVLTDG